MVLITGANGLVGEYILKRYLKSNHRIRALIRPETYEKEKNQLPSGVEWKPGSLFNLGNLEEQLEGVEYIIHAAGMISFKAQERSEMRNFNVEGTRNLVNMALNRPIKKFSFISSIVTIGQSPEKDLGDETSAWEEKDAHSYYTKTKYWAELEVWRGIAEGLPGLILNPSMVIGPGDWNKSSTQIFRYAWQEPKYAPPGQINYVDGRDLADMVYEFTQGELEKERILLNTGQVSFQEFLSLCADKFGVKAPQKVYRASFLKKIAWGLRLLNTVGIPTGQYQAERIEMSLLRKQYANDKLKKYYSSDFRSLDESLSWTVQALIKKYNLKVNQ